MQTPSPADVAVAGDGSVSPPGRSVLQESLAPAQIIQSSATYRSQLPKARSLLFSGFVPVFN